jgi:hypothetical protein
MKDDRPVGPLLPLFQQNVLAIPKLLLRSILGSRMIANGYYKNGGNLPWLSIFLLRNG